MIKDTDKCSECAKCLECEEETMLELSSLQTDHYELNEEYKALENAFNSYRKFAEIKMEHLKNKAEKCEMWHKSFLTQSEKLDIFRNDPYFEKLTLFQIAELAKKSIRLTSNHCEDRHFLEELVEILIDNTASNETKIKIVTNKIQEQLYGKEESEEIEE